MLVNLQDDWFNHEGLLVRKSNNPHELPDDWLAVLPSTASIQQKDGKEWKKVRDLRPGLDGKLPEEKKAEELPKLSPALHNAESAAVGGIDSAVMQGTKDTLSAPPNSPGGNRPANPPSLSQAVDEVDEIGANAGKNPGNAGTTRPEAKPIPKK